MCLSVCLYIHQYICTSGGMSISIIISNTLGQLPYLIDLEPQFSSDHCMGITWIGVLEYQVIGWTFSYQVYVHTNAK